MNISWEKKKKVVNVMTERGMKCELKSAQFRKEFPVTPDILVELIAEFNRKRMLDILELRYKNSILTIIVSTENEKQIERIEDVFFAVLPI